MIYMHAHTMFAVQSKQPWKQCLMSNSMFSTYLGFGILVSFIYVFHGNKLLEDSGKTTCFRNIEWGDAVTGVVGGQMGLQCLRS